MVFFRAARAAGLTIRFSKDGFVYENEPAERATFGYQLYVHFWHGNSAALACIESGMKRSRMFVHGAASLVRAIARPASRVVPRSDPAVALLPRPDCCTRPASCLAPPACASTIDSPCAYCSPFPAFIASVAEPKSCSRSVAQQIASRGRTPGHVGRFRRAARRSRLRFHPRARRLARAVRALAQATVLPSRVHVRGADLRRGPRCIAGGRTGRRDDDLQLSLHELGVAPSALRKARLRMFS